MEIGLLTVPFAGRPLDKVVEFAGAHGFHSLEVEAGPGAEHLDTTGFGEAEALRLRKMLAGAGVRVSSLAFYSNLLDPDPQRRAELAAGLRSVVDAAAVLEVEVVCTLAGMPMPGKDRMATIEEDFPGVFSPLVEYAAERGVRIAFENWFATNIQNLEHWQRVFEVVPAANLGLNFDPSHLYWQGIDPLEAVETFRDRIFHTHAKDVEIKQHVLRRVGSQADGWWRYVIPGYGEIDWGVYVARLRDVGYDGVLSIEHEDRAFGVEEGFVKGQRHLAAWV